MNDKKIIHTGTPLNFNFKHGGRDNDLPMTATEIAMRRASRIVAKERPELGFHHDIPKDLTIEMMLDAWKIFSQPQPYNFPHGPVPIEFKKRELPAYLSPLKQQEPSDN